jgi:hypothetical protein
LALDQLRAADAARGLETVIVPLDDPETGRYAALFATDTTNAQFAKDAVDEAFHAQGSGSTSSAARPARHRDRFCICTECSSAVSASLKDGEMSPGTSLPWWMRRRSRGPRCAH